MRIHPENNLFGVGKLEKALESDSNLLNQVNNRLAGQSFLKKLSYCFPNQYKEARQLKTLQILLEKDKEDLMPISTNTTCRGNIRHHYSQIHPIEEEVDLVLKKLIDNVNLGIREIPICQKKTWFKDHEKNIKALIQATNSNQPFTISSIRIRER